MSLNIIDKVMKPNFKNSQTLHQQIAWHEKTKSVFGSST